MNTDDKEVEARRIAAADEAEEREAATAHMTIADMDERRRC